jgi:transcriptional regulator of acetoin/glycerol metabolism
MSLSRSVANEAADEDGPPSDETIIGRSEAMRRLKRTIAQVAATDATVLVARRNRHGKGTGRQGDPRREPPAGEASCAGELRGSAGYLDRVRVLRSRKGAPLPVQRPGGRGALPLPTAVLYSWMKVGELPLELQAKLLRVLQEGEFEPVGSDRTKARGRATDCSHQS